MPEHVAHTEFRGIGAEWLQEAVEETLDDEVGLVDPFNVLYLTVKSAPEYDFS